jgi:hypothetical protein
MVAQGMTNTLTIAATCALLVFNAACDLSVDPPPGMVETISVVHENSILAPDSVTRGIPFVVQFSTGGYFCFRWAGHLVKQTATSVEIEPRMLINLTDPLCDLGNGFTHRVTLQHDRVGPLTVIIRSLSKWPGAPPVDTLAFERTIIVR